MRLFVIILTINVHPFSKINLSVTKIAGEYNLLIIFLNHDYTEEDEKDEFKVFLFILFIFFSVIMVQKTEWTVWYAYD